MAAVVAAGGYVDNCSADYTVTHIPTSRWPTHCHSFSSNTWAAHFYRKKFALSNHAVETSDIDIVVEMPLDLFQMVPVKEYLEQLLDRPVDLIRLHKHMNAFLRSRIDNEAIYV